MNPKIFKAPFISREQIWEEADKLRVKYWPPKKLPIDIETIAEFDLGLDFLPIDGLRREGDTDALLLGDLKTIAIDKSDYLDNRAQNRLRFSIAHEVGHLVLHGKLFSEIRHASVEEWVNFIQLIPDSEYGWIESHAYEFAGRLLVPREALIEEFNRTRAMAKLDGFDKWDSSGEAALEYISKDIAKTFAVSGMVIARRLKREQVWQSRNS